MADETDANPLVAELTAETVTIEEVPEQPPTLDNVSRRCAELINLLPPDQRQLVVKAIRSEFGG